jgi:hypothetical protein
MIKTWKIHIKMLVVLFSLLLIGFIPNTVLALEENVVTVANQEEFLNAVNDPDVSKILLTSDIDLPKSSGSVVIDVSGRTIDLGKHTLSMYNFSYIFQGNNFVIQNGNIKANDNGSYALFVGDGPTSNVLIQQVTLTGGINLYNTTNVTLRDVDITGTNYYAIWCDEGGQVTVESGNFQTNGNALLGTANGNVDVSLSIQGGNFTTNGKPLVLVDKEDRTPPVISGGSFDCSAKDYLAEELAYEVNASGTYTYYKTIEDAMEHAQDGAEISAVTATDDSFQATLEYNDTTGKEIVITTDENNQITLPSLSRSGYLFLGWKVGSTQSLIEAGDNYILTENTTFTGTWKLLTYTEVKAVEPTCDKVGNIAYWFCNEIEGMYFKDANATEPITLEDTILPPIGHKFENGICTVCKADDPDYIAPVSPVIIAGANGKWQQNGKDGLSFTSNAEFDDFLKVQVDGKDLASSNYTVKEGSTIITLNPTYLKTLSVGKHTLAIVSANGTASTEFMIEVATETDDETNPPQAGETAVPQTGDNSNMVLWSALLLVFAAIISGTAIYGKKKTYSK